MLLNALCASCHGKMSLPLDCRDRAAKFAQDRQKFCATAPQLSKNAARLALRKRSFGMKIARFWVRLTDGGVVDCKTNSIVFR